MPFRPVRLHCHKAYVPVKGSGGAEPQGPFKYRGSRCLMTLREDDFLDY